MSILRMLCFAYLNILFSLAFIYLKAKHWYFSILFNKKIKDFQGPKTNFKHSFQGLEIGLLKFKGFQDMYKPLVYMQFYPGGGLVS